MDFLAVVILLCAGAMLMYFMFFSDYGKPQDTTAGRWGTKVGKVVRGEFGGEKWGEKEKK